MTETKPKHRWLRFAIRDLLWLTVFVGLATGQWLDHRRLTAEIMVNNAIANDDEYSDCGGPSKRVSHWSRRLQMAQPRDTFGI